MHAIDNQRDWFEQQYQCNHTHDIRDPGHCHSVQDFDQWQQQRRLEQAQAKQLFMTDLSKIEERIVRIDMDGPVSGTLTGRIVQSEPKPSRAVMVAPKSFSDRVAEALKDTKKLLSTEIVKKDPEPERIVKQPCGKSAVKGINFVPEVGARYLAWTKGEYA